MNEKQNSVAKDQENQPNNEEVINVAPGSDVEIIKVSTPSFFQSHFLHLLIIFGLGFLVFTYIFSIYLTPIHVVGISMQPTINVSVTGNNDTTHIDTVYYRAKNNYNVGDIVIVDATNYLTDESRTIIKRVIATAGQIITFKITTIETAKYGPLEYIKAYYTLLIDGNKISESYINDQTCYLNFSVDYNNGNYKDNNDYKLIVELYNALKTSPGYMSTGEYSYTVPENHLFICGDNRNNSTDSRYFGAVNQCDVLGNVRLHVKYKQNLFVSIWHKVFGNIQLAY